MRPFLSFFQRLLWQLGFDVRRFARAVKGLLRFPADLIKYRQLKANPAFRFSWRYLYPILSDFTENAGIAGGHYFHMDLWAARKIFQTQPQLHYDIGSRLDGFIAHVLTFAPVTVIDIRPMTSNIEGLNFIQADATTMAEFESDSIGSLSALHSAEHFGLGRYGDPVDPFAHEKFMGALQRVLAPGGRLYFAVPVGHQRVEFNAHRVFSPGTIISLFSELDLVSFAAVRDNGELDTRCNPDDLENEQYGCGLFEFTKKSNAVST